MRMACEINLACDDEKKPRKRSIKVKKTQEQKLINELVMLQFMAGQLGMYETMHAIDAAKDKAGWEYATRLKHGK